MILDDILYDIYRISYDKIRYPNENKIAKEMDEIIANIEDNVYVFKDESCSEQQSILINWNVFYYSYEDIKRDEEIRHFWEYEYKIKWEKLYVRWLYIREDCRSTLPDWWDWDKIMIKVDWWWDVWTHRSAWWNKTEKYIFKKEKTDWWWMEREEMYSTKAKEIIMNHINGEKDLNSNYKEMLIPRDEVERIAKEYVWSLDNIELHFSQLFRSRNKDYDYYFFHRKNAFKFNEKYVVIICKNDNKLNNEYVLKFESNELKKLFDKKKKKDGDEESDFIRIRINGDNTASFELWNWELVDVTNNIVKRAQIGV